MSNPNAPFGFRFVGLLDGVSPNAGYRRARLSSATTAQVNSGDVLTPVSSGLVALSSATGASASGIAGVAKGFSWLSKTAGRRVWSNAWYGATTDVSSGEVDVELYNHPHAVFEVQVKASALTYTSLGLNLNFATATGNTAGISAWSLDGTTASTQTTLPFRLHRVPGTAPDTGIAPRDPGSDYNVVHVVFNNLAVF